MAISSRQFRQRLRGAAVFLLLGCDLATADTFLVKSTDGGRTWADIDPGPPSQLLASLNIDSRTSALYALTRNDLNAEARLLVSTDRGETWQNRQSFPAAVSWNIAAAVGADALYLAHEDSVRFPKSAIITKVTDGGQAVEQYQAEGLTITQGSVPNSFGGYLTRLVAAPPTTLYAVVTNEYADDLYAFFQALWMSTDGGRSWRRLEPPVSPNCAYPGIWIDSSDSSVYLACGHSEFLRSSDGGESWTRKQTPHVGGLLNLQIGQGAPAVLYSVFGGAIWRSTDGAETWQRSGDLPFEVNDLRVHPANPSVIFGWLVPGSGAPVTGVWKSENGGESWTKFAELGVNFNIQVDPLAPDTLYGWSRWRQEPRLNDRQTFLRNLLGEKQVAPGSLVSIYGSDLASETRVAGSTSLPTSMAGASVSFDGRPAPLLFVSPGQIKAQVPFGLAAESGAYPSTTSLTMEVRRPDGSLDRQTISLSSRAVMVLRENLARQAAPLCFTPRISGA